MIKKEWKSIRKNPLMLLVLLAIILIPSIYTTFFLASMWDPYGNLGQLPVAVVNLDKDVMYKDKELSIGTDLVNNLKENKELDFHFVDKEEADAGIRSGKYYMVITIPEDFSANASTLLDDHPKQMCLNYDTNPGTNYIASKLSNTALAKIENKVADEVTRTYAESVFDQLSEIGDGLDAGADGAGRLLDGADALLDGNEKIVTNLETLANSTLTFQDGSTTLKKGLYTYTDGVKQLAAGAKDLKDGTSQLANGSATLKKGVTKLQKGIADLEQGAKNLEGLTKIDQVYQGVQTMKAAVCDGSDKNPSLQEATKQLAAGLATLDASTSQLDGALNSVGSLLEKSKNTMSQQAMVMGQVTGTLEQVLGNDQLDGETRATLEALLQSVKGVSPSVEAVTMPEIDAASLQALCSGIHTAAMASQSIASGTEELAAGLSTLEQKTKDFPAAATGMSQLIDGIETLKTSTDALATGTTTLDAGIQSMDYGASSLKTGANQLQSNNDKLMQGATALDEGAAKLHDGTKQLAEGSHKVQDGLEDVKDGSKELSTSLMDGAKEIRDNEASTQTLDMFATPVTSEETKISEVPDNGSAMSAYMMCVGLWVGALAFCLLYPLTKYEGKLTSGLTWWASKASVAYPIAIAMAFVMLAALHLFCGFHPANLGKTIWIACVAAMTFMAIMYFFNVAFGKIGSFFMLIFMVIQLAGSAGTYPVEISAGFVAKIHNLLPFSYVVEAFRKGICGQGNVLQATVVLGVWFVVFTVLTILLFHFRGRRIEEGKENLHDKLEQVGLA